MTNKERLQNNLLTNIKFVAVLQGATILLFVYKLYQLFWADVTLIEMNSRLLLGDYLVFILLIVGSITMGVSIYFYKWLPKQNIKTQHTILLVSGILLLPHSLLLLVTGLKIGIDNSRYESRNAMYGFLSLVVFLVFYGMLLLNISTAVPEYVHSTTYEFEYRFDEDNYILFDLEVVYDDEEIKFVDINANANIPVLSTLDDELSRLAFTLEAIQDPSLKLCLEIISDGPAIENQEYSCRSTLAEVPYLTLADLDSFEDIYLRAIYEDIWLGFDTEVLNITLIEETYKDNYYE